MRTIAEPREAKARPESGYTAAFSGPYTVAAALLGGSGLGVSHEDFTDEAATDSARRALTEKIRCVDDPPCTEIFPHQFPAVLRVRTYTGQLYEARVDANRGGPENPLSPEELTTKFRLNAQRATSPDRADDIADSARRLPSLDKVSDLTTLIR